MGGPLSGIRVLDLTRVLSGPFASQQLVDLGAEVIKIEHPEGGDDTRRFGPPFIEGVSTYFLSVNRGKRSVAINLKHPRGREIVMALAARSDVVIENFRPGTAERLGLGAAALREAHPSLITCSISGYGTGGAPAFEGLPGYDSVVQAGSGIMALTGEPHGPPVKVGVAIADLVAGLYATQGILSALFARNESGKGRHVEVSMQDASCALLTYQAGIYFATGKNPLRMGNAHPSICPYETVQTKDGAYTLAVGNDRQFKRFVHALSLPWLKDDPRFATNRDRVENRGALMALLTPKFREKTRAEWNRILSEAQIPGGPVLEVSQAMEHPQFVARGSVLEHDHPVAGRVKTVAPPIRFDGQGPSPIRAPPLLGADTRDVVIGLLGLEPSEVEQMIADGVLAEGDPSAA